MAVFVNLSPFCSSLSAAGDECTECEGVGSSPPPSAQALSLPERTARPILRPRLLFHHTPFLRSEPVLTMAPQAFTKVDVTPKRHHGYSVVLFIFGTLFPPLGECCEPFQMNGTSYIGDDLAVAARFGIGGDFWLNLLLTICGYIPGEGRPATVSHPRADGTRRTRTQLLYPGGSWAHTWARWHLLTAFSSVERS